MCDEKKNISICKKRKKERKSHEMSRVLVRVFNVYFIIKSSLKSIKIHHKKESIEIYILLNIIKLFLSCKIF